MHSHSLSVKNMAPNFGHIGDSRCGGSPELRLNPLTREWVVIEKSGIVKPEDFVEKRPIKELPDHSGTCHFCVGNEDCMPDEIYRVEGEKGWNVRVVRNGFSRLSEESPLRRWGSGIQRTANSVGLHEIIIETPFHNHSTASMPPDQLKSVIETYKKRLIEIYRDPRVEYVVIFKNSGLLSGTSCEHSLTQMVGIPVTPLQIRDRVEAYMKFHDDTGECLMCRLIREETQDGERIVVETENFISCVPYAAFSPFHLWIFPKRHSGSISDMTQDEMQDLAKILKTTMLKLCHGLGDPDFNYAIKSSSPGNCASTFQHWYMSIVPRISYISGFEIASGMYVNPVQPELSAKFLREIAIPQF